MGSRQKEIAHEGVSRCRAAGPGLERTQRSFRVYLTLLQGVFQRWIVKGGMEKFGSII